MLSMKPAALTTTGGCPWFVHRYSRRSPSESQYVYALCASHVRSQLSQSFTAYGVLRQPGYAVDSDNNFCFSSIRLC